MTHDTSVPDDVLARGNEAFRAGHLATAMRCYVDAWLGGRAHPASTAMNMRLVRGRRLREGRQAARPRVGVFCWDLSHNAAGRAETLHAIYSRFADALLMGCLLGTHARLWRPLQLARRDVAVLECADGDRFVDRALEFVARHPLDVVHVSKTRLPSVIVGVLYKMLWGSTVLVDIDDDELAFEAAAQAEPAGAPIDNTDLSWLRGPDATRLAVQLAKAFDGETVVNGALQARFGGELLPHARDESRFKADPENQRALRARLGLSATKKLVMFLGTPRRHKGVLAAAELLASLGRDDVQFVVVGSFDDPALRQALRSVKPLDLALVDDQSLDLAPSLIACAACCLALQDPESPVARAQTPAKLSDALAAGVPVCVTNVEPMREAILRQAVVRIDWPVRGIAAARLVGQVLDGLPVAGYDPASARAYFRQELSIDSADKRLRTLLRGVASRAAGTGERIAALLVPRLPRVRELLRALVPVTPAWPGGAPAQARTLQQDFQALLAGDAVASIAQTTAGTRRRVIYTAITGGYDELVDPPHVMPDCDYVVFCDRPMVPGKVWQPRPIDYFEGDPTRTARFIKLHPHLYFPEHDESIWVDANIAFRESAQPFFDALGGDGVMALFPHPHRRCVYVEGNECARRNKDSSEEIQAQLKRYRDRGFPDDGGLWETGILVRRHNDPHSIKLMTTWWRELFLGSRRDQIALPVAVAEVGVEPILLAPLGSDLRHHPLVAFIKHRAQAAAAPGAAPTYAWSTSTAAPARRNAEGRVPVDVGVCVYNSPEEVRRCIDSVLRTRGREDRLIIVDDGSRDDTAQLLRDVVSVHERVLLIRHALNKGYTRSANDVLRASNKPYVILLNSDTELSAGAIDRLVACGEGSKHLGIVGPLSNAAGWQTVPVLHAAAGGFEVNPLPEGLGLDGMARACASESVGPALVPLVNGFCFAVKRAVIEAIGYLDEEAFPIGYGEEDDFCLRAGDHGFLCAIATDAYVYHSKSATFTSERRKVLAKQGGVALRSKHSALRVNRSANVAQHHPRLVEMRARLTARLALLPKRPATAEIGQSPAQPAEEIGSPM